MLTVIYLILILGLLIFVHELGHFLAAKKIGVYVYEFAIGMGPKIFSFKRKKHNDPTLYSLRAFPIGGFCAIAGETDEQEEDKKLKKSELMCNRSKWEKTAILLAGVTNNIILALILLFVQALIWGSTEQKPIIGYVQPDSAIANAGIKVGDTIKEINGYKINTWDKLTIILNLKNKSNTYEFVIKKADGTIKRYNLTPKTVKAKDGSETKVFGLGSGTKVTKGFLNAIKFSFTKLGSIVYTMWLILWALITGQIGLSSLSGPVGMYSVVGESGKYGIESVMYLTAYLSINLAVINALPFPAFDGGHVLFIVIEAITKKKVNPKVENIIHTIGFILLMLLMLLITVKDIIKLF